MMSKQVKLPALSETEDTGIVAAVLVEVGDTIEPGQAVIEIETGKAVVEVPSDVGGTVTAIHVSVGDEISVGQPLITVDVGSEEAGDDAAGEGAAAAAPAVPEAPDVVTPAPAAQPQPEAAPATPPVDQPEPAVAASTPATSVPAVPAGNGEPATRRLIPASPSVRRFARELGVDITQVAGTGPGGRITIEDVKAFVSARQAAAAPAPAMAPAAAPVAPTAAAPVVQVSDFSQWGPVDIQPLSSVRRATARQTATAWMTIPHVTHHDKADITELEKIRRHYAPKVEAAGGKLTVTAIIVKVVASALKVFPKFNTSVDMDNNQLIYKKYYNIGVAVDTEHGLLVPVIRDVDRKNLIELSVELTEISQRARERRLSMEEMQGGCFTVSNLGGIGGTSFNPIVNQPEVAILGVARSRMEPVYIDGEFQPRLILPLALSYDHRVIDGADGARFMRWIVEALEDPFMVTLEG